MSREIEINVKVGPHGVGVLEWSTATTLDGLTRALSVAGDESLLGHELRRLEFSLPSGDQLARRAALRAGFRQEGVRRAAWQNAKGEFEDVVLYARLADDVTRGPAAMSGVMNSVMPRKRLIAHVLMRDAEQRILLCRTTFKEDWELPGGIVEPGETPRDGAIREVAEELGLDLDVGHLLIMDWMPPHLGWEDACELIFDGGTVTDDDLAGFTLDGHEIAEVRLVSLAEAADLVTPISHRRLTVAGELGSAGFAYTENGTPLAP